MEESEHPAGAAPGRVPGPVQGLRVLQPARPGGVGALHLPDVAASALRRREQLRPGMFYDEEKALKLIVREIISIHYSLSPDPKLFNLLILDQPAQLPPQAQGGAEEGRATARRRPEPYAHTAVPPC